MPYQQDRRREDSRLKEIEEKIDRLAQSFQNYEPYLKDAVQNQAYWASVKNENIKNVVKGAVWATFIAVCTALWLLLKQALGLAK